MGDCHLSYTTDCQYACCCPDCSPPKRRSSRPTEHAAPSAISRRSRSSSENMELEYEPQNFWFLEQQVPRYRSSQLCELPTSYINNCQSAPVNTDTAKPNVRDLCQQQQYYPRKMKQPASTQEVRKVAAAPPAALRTNCLHSRLSFDTGTYFNTIKNTTNPDLHERYSKEIEMIRDKINMWKQGESMKTASIEEDATAKLHERYRKEVESMKEKLGLVNNNLNRGDACAQAQKPDLGVRMSKRIVLRPKSRALQKPIRKLSGKSAPNSAEIARKTVKQIVESECSFSDESEDEEEVGDETSSESLDNTTIIRTQPHPVTITVPRANKEAGDSSAPGWPIRPSLFPHVPPYIRFTPHDSETAVVLPNGRKHFKWKLSTITPILVRKTLVNSGFVMVRKSNQWMGTWGKHMKSPMFKTLKDSQKLNHFPGTFQLGRKDRLWRNFQRLINRHGYKEFGFIPQTFVLPQELKILKQNWDCANPNEAWIIKPPASARGTGIKVINRWSQLPKKMSLVVQKYISNPYLINGSKFDLRLYVLVTSFDPLKIYLYPDGLARFASAKYSSEPKDLKDRYVHLTNYSINKLSSQYTANEDANSCQGHKWTLTKLWEILEKDGIDTKLLWAKLQQLVIKTMITGEAPIYNLCQENMLNRYNCYELLGVDVLLDERLKPWLLEVNISPSLHSSSPLDAHVKGPMVHTLFDLAQFHFPARLSGGHQSGAQSTVPQTYDPRLYTMNLTRKEREKHSLFVRYEHRSDYLEDILTKLSGDDVRQLLLAEDELVAKGNFERIFPTAQSHRYLDFMETRYYNRLFDAWETKYENNRQAGIDKLTALCQERVHLKIASASNVQKSSLNMIPAEVNLQPSKEGQSRPEVTITQEIKSISNPSCK